jgi:hypothetical protein
MVTLAQGVNHITLRKGDGYAELDWAQLSAPSAPAP